VHWPPAGHAGLSALAEQAVTHWLAWPKTYGMDAVAVPALRRLAERPALLNRPACLRLRAAALDHLRARCSMDMAPPADWRREADRCHVEDSIRLGRCDVDISTERKGSPHVLVCTKNLASYERRVAQRRSDLDDLARLKAQACAAGWPTGARCHALRTTAVQSPPSPAARRRTRPRVAPGARPARP
jgi:hypothetical protein